MHNDSAAAIALNRSGLTLTIDNEDEFLNDSQFCSTEHILGYYQSQPPDHHLESNNENNDNIGKKWKNNKNDIIIRDNLPHRSKQSPPIVVYNERTAL